MNQLIIEILAKCVVCACSHLKLFVLINTSLVIIVLLEKDPCCGHCFGRVCEMQYLWRLLVKHTDVYVCALFCNNYVG
jgi:hypothetical protein